MELFGRRCEVAELVGGCSRGGKRERGKGCSQQRVQIVNRADTNGDMWAVMFTSMLGKVGGNESDTVICDRAKNQRRGRLAPGPLTIMDHSFRALVPTVRAEGLPDPRAERA